MAVDRVVGDPRKGHPVALFGTASARLEEHTYRDSRCAGAVHALCCVTPVVVLGLGAERIGKGRPVVHLLSTAAVTWACVGARTLAVEGRIMADALDRGALDGDLTEARRRLPHLCGRDPAGLDEPELARATVESLAENTSDAVVCPLFWGALAGMPGLLAHRAVNTLDAMVGHRSARYRHFGTVSARTDDVMAWLPARITGVLACVVAPAAGGDRGAAWRMMCRDHAAHPSPNGGWCEAAWAGASGVRLGGRNVYAQRVEERPYLGEGPAPEAATVRQASRLVEVVSLAATGIAAAGLAAAGLAAAGAVGDGRRRARRTVSS